MTKKKCSKCGKTKLLYEFYFRKDSNKYRNECKECFFKKTKEYRLLHKEQRKKSSKSYHERHKEQEKQYRKGRAKLKQQYDKIYYQENKEKHNQQVKKYMKKRRRNDLSFKLLNYLRTRIWRALKNKTKKSNKTMELVGCSLEELKNHLESQFKPGMTWDNHGTGANGKGMKEWHIDHILPCCTFDLINENEQQKCFFYKNLQPLWAKENLQKNRKKL